MTVTEVAGHPCCSSWLRCNFIAVSSGALTGIKPSSSALLFSFYWTPSNKSVRMWSVNSTQQDQKAVLRVKQRGLPLPEPFISPRASRHAQLSFYPILQENATGHMSVPMFHGSSWACEKIIQSICPRLLLPDIFLTFSGRSFRQFPHFISGFLAASYFVFCLEDNYKAKDHMAMVMDRLTDMNRTVVSTSENVYVKWDRRSLCVVRGGCWMISISCCTTGLFSSAK